MIIPDKKKAVSVILSKFGADGSQKMGDVKDESDMGESSPLKTIAEDIMMAFQSKSVHDLMLGLKAFYDECEVGEDEGPEQE